MNKWSLLIEFLMSRLKHGNLPSLLRTKNGEECGSLLFLVVHLLICKSFNFYNYFLFSPNLKNLILIFQLLLKHHIHKH